MEDLIFGVGFVIAMGLMFFLMTHDQLEWAILMGIFALMLKSEIDK